MVICNFKPSSTVILIIHCYMQDFFFFLFFPLCSLIDVTYEMSCIKDCFILLILIISCYVNFLLCEIMRKEIKYHLKQKKSTL